MRTYDHPLRTVLHEEVHARPPVALWPKDRILNQAFLLKAADRAKQLEWVNSISEKLNQAADPHHGQSFRIIELQPAPDIQINDLGVYASHLAKQRLLIRT